MAARRGPKSPPAKGPDRKALERAFAAVLAATGAPLDDPELAGTARRAAAAWADEFLDGYTRTPSQALGELSPAPKSAGLVVMTDLDYVGVCPHHLLPYRGVAHLAYRPGAHLVGFGRLAALVDTLSHRLVLQETLAADLARALVEGIGALGAGVVLDAEQTCLTMRGEKRPRSRALVEATAGRFTASDLDRLRAASRGRPEPG